MKVIVPDSTGEASNESSTGASSSEKSEKEGGAGSGNASSPRNKSGQGRKASPTQKKTQKEKSEGSHGIDLDDSQGESEKKLDKIQKEANDELDRANKMLDESLKFYEKIRSARRKRNQPSSSPPCTSTSGNVGVTHEFIDGIKECNCDGETCRWK